MKRCCRCRILKPRSEFHKDKTTMDGFKAECKICRQLRNYQYWLENKERIKKRNCDNYLFRTYGMTQIQKQQIVNSQNGKCAICNKEIESTGRDSCVDHCHKNGKVRQVLCHNCNLALGYTGEDIGTLQNMINYIKKHKEQES